MLYHSVIALLKTTARINKDNIMRRLLNLALIPQLDAFGLTWVNAFHTRGVMHEDICSGICSALLSSMPHSQGTHSCQLLGLMSASGSGQLEIVLPLDYTCPQEKPASKITGRQGCEVLPNNFPVPIFLSQSLFPGNST